MKRTKTFIVMSVLAILTMAGVMAIPVKPACASTSNGIGHAPPDNCAWVGSCGPKLNQCFRLGFGGGSQYVYDNKIPACLQEGRDCYAVKCHVKQFTDEQCQNLDDDTSVDRTGCRKPK